MENFRTQNGKDQKLIFCRYITRKGKRIYPKNGQFFAFWVDVK